MNTVKSLKELKTGLSFSQSIKHNAVSDCLSEMSKEDLCEIPVAFVTPEVRKAFEMWAENFRISKDGTEYIIVRINSFLLRLL